MKRNNLVTRRARNTKQARASLNETVIRDYFDQLDAAGEIDPNNMYNYDETSLSDDTGCKKVIVLRGSKRVELVNEHSKLNITIMACGSVGGELLPPVACYKALLYLQLCL